MNTASGAGLVGYPGQSPYVSSKHGVLGLTKSAALEYGRQGVRVNAVCPGTVLTPMVEAATQVPGLEAQLVALHPIGRIGTPEEIANAVLWLVLRRRVVRARSRARRRRRATSSPDRVPCVVRSTRARVTNTRSSHLEGCRMAVDPIPAGYPRVTPYLCCRGAADAIEFYKAVFGATRAHADAR